MNRKLLNKTETAEYIGYKTTKSLAEVRERDGSFPKPIIPYEGASERWDTDDLDAWIESKKAASDAD